ncbi:hypothetical protein TRVL_03716 [Trypanosoma vivax]|uniref:RRM domain-containing protein n=1 Tax=Trypanosoma vivax (strain Y486) TaxID=1055687 RepID=G0TRM1_TRYVY|nr:hypothetical protein TRVL_03716 [Trypanosoma vivax]CCC46591.1 conserved hypothetical protein [Trypanosoma vivax Y486]
MTSLESLLAPTHNIVVQHSQLLSPTQLRAVAESYGTVDELLSYHLKEGSDLVSIIQYKNTSDGKWCYESMRHISKVYNNYVRGVAWIHEESALLFKHKSYVGALYCPDEGSKVDTTEVCLLVYMSSISEIMRSVFLTSLNSIEGVLDLFVDDVSGGRCFLTFPNVEVAEKARRTVLASRPELGNNIHYCDTKDFLLASEKQGGK